MSDVELKAYLSSHYGSCAFAAKTGACACLRGQRHAELALCPDWVPVTESNWTDMYLRAVHWHDAKKIDNP